MKKIKPNIKNSERQLLHMRVKAAILEKYRTENCTPGSPFPSSRELIKKFNVSKVTMGRVFAELKKDNIVYSVPKVGMFWGTRKNLTIYKTIGVRLGVRSLAYLTPDTYYFYMLQGLEEVFSKHNLHTKLLHYKSLDSTDGIRELGCDAVICTGTYSPVLDAVNDFKKMGIPYLLLDRPCGDEKLNYLERDSAGNIEEIVDYLVSLGHRKISCVGIEPKLWIDKKLYLGFESGMRKNGLDCSEAVLKLPDFGNGSFANFKDLLRKHTALIVLSPLKNDTEAVLEYCSCNKIKVPEDCSLITLSTANMAIGNNTVTSHIITPYEMGVKAAEGIVGLLNNTVEEPLHIKFPLKTTEGSTVNAI